MKSIPLWLFPVLTSVVQGAASLRYVMNGQHRLAIVWLGVALSNLALAGVKN